MDTLDYVAIYGAAVATGILIWNGIAVYRDRTSIKVKVAFVFLHNAIGYDPNKRHIGLTAMNKGRRPVTLSGAGLRLSNRIDLGYLPHTGDFPRPLNEGESHDIFLNEDMLKESLRNERKHTPRVSIEFAWFRDQTGRLYKSKLPKNIENALLE